MARQSKSLLNLTQNRERVKEDAQTFSLSNRLCANTKLMELGAAEGDGAGEKDSSLTQATWDVWVGTASGASVVLGPSVSFLKTPDKLRPLF